MIVEYPLREQEKFRIFPEKLGEQAALAAALRLSNRHSRHFFWTEKKLAAPRDIAPQFVPIRLEGSELVLIAA